MFDQLKVSELWQTTFSFIIIKYSKEYFVICNPFEIHINIFFFDKNLSVPSE